jgi:hypothetical protein
MRVLEFLMPRSVSAWRALLSPEASANECAVKIWTHCDHSFDSRGYAYMSLLDLANAIEALRHDVTKSDAMASSETPTERSAGAAPRISISASTGGVHVKPSRVRYLIGRFILGSSWDEIRFRLPRGEAPQTSAGLRFDALAARKG